MTLLNNLREVTRRKYKMFEGIEMQTGQERSKTLISIIRKRPNDETLKAMLYELYYDMKYQCSICGMRYQHSPQLANHLNWHFKLNMYMRERKTKHECRPPLASVESWVKEETLETTKETLAAEEEEEKEEFLPDSIPAPELEQPICYICNEAFHQVWDLEKQRWLLASAIKVKFEDDAAGETTLLHKKCYKTLLKKELETSEKIEIEAL